MHRKFMQIVLENPTRSYAEALEMLPFAYPPAPVPADDTDPVLAEVARIEQAHRRDR
jgi:hypothetical protein